MGRRILIVEDIPANVVLTAAILENAGHVPITASNGAEGVETARRERPDVVLMDIQMPGMDGLAATRLLKQDEATRHIPVIAVTASAMKGDEERALEAGCCGYVTKPIRYRELLAAVDAALAGSGTG